MSWKVVTESLENTDIVGLYPITGDTAIDAQIEAFIAEFTDAYLPQLESIRSQGYRSELAYRLNPSVITGSLAAFRFTGSFYAAGGANPTQLVDALVLNELGQVVDPLAGFTDSGGLLVNLVIQQIGSNPDYFLPEDGLLPYAAWIPASQGMIAGFDEYEIAAGYLGTQEIDIGWEELSEAIDPNGIYQDVTDGWLTSVPFLVPP